MSIEFEIRRGLRDAGASLPDHEPIDPEIIEKEADIQFGRILEQFGSVANAATLAGVPYLNTTGNEQAILAQTDQTWRIDAIETARNLAEASESLPSLYEISLNISRGQHQLQTAFGSHHAVLREAGIDPVEPTDTVPIPARTATIRESARELGTVPSPMFVAQTSEYSLQEVASWFDTWALAVEASYGTAPNMESFTRAALQNGDAPVARKDVAPIVTSQVRSADFIDGHPSPDPTAELIHNIETLAERIAHRPNATEVSEYLPYSRAAFTTNFGQDEPIEIAIRSASVPSERDLSPSGSLNRQPNVAVGDVPTHTDLLCDIHIVHKRGPDDILTDFEVRGILDQRHYEVQFGSLEQAVRAHSKFKPSDYREERDAVIAPVLQDTVNELTTLLERRPTAIETVEITDYSISEFIKEFDSWMAVVDGTPTVSSWSNQALLEDLELVGQVVGHPPTPSDIVDASRFPFGSYIRRFGSLPAILRNVGVELPADIPEEYQAVSAAREVWEQTEKLVSASFSVDSAFHDDLWRLCHEFGTAPSRKQYEQYGLYQPDLIGTDDGWIETLSQAGFDQPDTGEAYRFRRRVFESTVESLAESQGLPVFPRDIEFSADYSVPTAAAEYGTLEAGFEAIGVETRHLILPVSVPQDVWESRQEATRELIAGLVQLAEATDGRVTLADIRADPDLTHNWVYYAFDSFSEAADVAGLTDSVVKTSETWSSDELSEHTSDNILDAMVREVEPPTEPSDE